jgi:hypothetical protein
VTVRLFPLRAVTLTISTFPLISSSVKKKLSLPVIAGNKEPSTTVKLVAEVVIPELRVVLPLFENFTATAITPD